jgi:predicted  nucleic acid-binding Zn-ribbon protein
LDYNKKESVVARYLGGPGKGQSQRAETILNQLKSVMERYTKKVMADYYDNLGDDTETLNKLKELKEKRDELNKEMSKLRYKASRLSDVINNLSYFESRLETEEGTDDEYREWVNEQKTKAGEFYQQMDNEKSKIEQENTEINDKITDIENSLDDKKLAFYDKEKNVPMTR